MSVISTLWNRFGKQPEPTTLEPVGDERGIPPLHKRKAFQNSGKVFAVTGVAGAVALLILWHHWQKQSQLDELAAQEAAKNATKQVSSASNDFSWDDVYARFNKPKPKPPAPEAPPPAPEAAAKPNSAPAKREKTPEELWRERRLKATVIAATANDVGDRSGVGTVRASMGAGGDMGASSNDELGGRLRPSLTAEASARFLPDRDFLITKGTMADCVLETRLVSSVAGMIRCVQSRDLYSDNMSVLLSERGTVWTGQYRGADIKPGMRRLFVLWERLKTPKGVTIFPNSPGTDPLGGGGLEGEIDTHFWERFGAAIMISLIDDFATAAAARDRPVTGDNNTVVGFPNTQASAQRLAEKALESSVNIPPTLYKNHGDPIGIFVARDLDFSTVYELRVKQGHEVAPPAATATPAAGVPSL